MRHESVRDDEWRRSGHACLIPEVSGEGVAEEPAGRDNLIGASQTAKGDVAQASADRVANDEGAGKHRHRGRHTEDHGEVRPPVVRDAAANEG